MIPMDCRYTIVLNTLMLGILGICIFTSYLIVMYYVLVDDLIRKEDSLA